MTRFRILIADPLLGMGITFPPGVALAGVAASGPAGTHWHFLDDPEAPPELEDREVQITMARDGDGQPVITGRRLIVTHLAAGDGIFTCCEALPWEVPSGDSVTCDPQAATCEAGIPAEAVTAGVR